MTTLENLRTRLIDRILVTKNEQLLTAIENIFNSTETDDKLALNSYQVEMLVMSEKDIEQENLISETELNKDDAEWMR